jgi:pyruvate/2-oxoglutarate dehydrogenase complex dihydrolipoamide dehydrogenase (E3) component
MRCAFRPTSLHGVVEILEGVVADPAVGIGREVGRIDGAERRPHLEAARERLAAGHGMASDAIAGARLHAGAIFINVGGRALVPPMPGISEVPYLTNSSMMDVDFRPHHLVIVGGSHIGLD